MTGSQIVPPASGSRVPWSAVPTWLQSAVEERLGSPVAEAVTQTGGFSPGAAARLRACDGTRVFVKAVGPEPNPDSPDIYRAEIRVASRLPADAPAPRLLESFDRDGWVALVFEDIDGAMPAQPWRADELERVLGALTGLAKSLTPAPVAVPTAADRLVRALWGWRRLHEASGEDVDRLDPWIRRHLSGLAALEAGWADAVEGDTLAHTDLRADNLLLTNDAVYFVDWPWACLAAPWFDLMCMLPSVRMQGGPPPEEIFDSHPVARGADPDGVTTVLAALAGFFVERSMQPPPPGIATVREFQAAQGRTALAWLQTRWP